VKPRIFLSTVSSELGSVRQSVAKMLRRLGYTPVWHDSIGTEPGDWKEALHDKIDSCQGLIQIIGRAYGAEPQEPDPEFLRVSYTQYELLYARRRNKKVWLLFAGDGCTRDRPLEQLDLPSTTDHPDPTGYQVERRALQDDWIERMGAYLHLWHAAANDTELELTLIGLKNEFAGLRRGLSRRQRVVLALGIAALLLVVCVLLVRWWAA
jgi:Domain of unknown function (DUF4062)